MREAAKPKRGWTGEPKKLPESHRDSGKCGSRREHDNGHWALATVIDRNSKRKGETDIGRNRGGRGGEFNMGRQFFSEGFIGRTLAQFTDRYDRIQSPVNKEEDERKNPERIKKNCADQPLTKT